MTDQSATTAAARRALAQRLESLRDAGVTALGKPPATVRVPPPAENVTAAQKVAPAASASPPTIPESAPMPARSPAAKSSPAPAVLAGTSVITSPFPAGNPTDAASRTQLLNVIRGEVAGCTRCRELVACRTQTVFGVGNVTPRVAFFGEAPGENEDKQGEPFVGRAGKLLNDIIKACTWQREDVFILNTVKCRPPSNRNPLPEEISNCRNFFERQLEILQPEYIVCLGSVAAQALLETETPVGKLRGKFHQYRGSKVVVTYHPAYLLRNPPAKKFTWEDMQMLLKDMGIAIPGKAT